MLQSDCANDKSVSKKVFLSSFIRLFSFIFYFFK